MPEYAGAKTTCEMTANGDAGQAALANTVHHSHMGAQESGVANADCRVDAYVICINNPAFKELWNDGK